MKSGIKSFVSALLTLLLVLSPLLALPVAAVGEAIAIAVELNSFRDEGDQGYTQNVGGDSASTLLWKKGNADATGGYLRLVPDELWKSGTVVRRSQIQLTDGFSTYFSFLMTTSEGTVDTLVDGLAFLIYESDSVKIGEYGGGLGYKGISQSIAVEFDNYKNGELNDPHDEHVAIMVNGDPNHADEPSGSVAEYTDLERNTIHAWVDYNEGSVTATFGTSSSRSNSANKTITRNVGTFLQGKNVFVGFSSSTGGAGGNHDLLKWYFKDSYVSGGLSAAANAYAQAASSVGVTFDSSTHASTATITTYSAAGTALANQSVSIYMDGVKQAGTFSTGSAGTLAYPLTNIYGGKHEIRVVAEGGATKAAEFTRDSIDTSTGNATYMNPTPVLVDSALVLRGFSESHMIPGARVTIDNYKSGDRLTPPASLPSGVTGTWDSNTGSLELSGNILASELQTLLRAVTFHTTSTDTTRRSVTLSLGSALPGETGHFYEYVAATLNWTDARNAAAAKTYLGLQGYMATITSQDENDLIASKVYADAWIGASDSTSEGNWYWVTGPETGKLISTGNYSSSTGTPIVASGSYMNWASGEPNDSGGEDYAHLYSTQSGKWNDFPHTKTIGFIVEYGGMSAYPVLSLTATRSIDMVFTYTITYNLDGGTNDTDAPATYTNVSDTITLGTPSKQGYTFAGWYDASTGGNKITSIATGTTGDKNFYARWTPATNTAYQVEHYQEKVDGSGYVLKETDLKTGTTGAAVIAAAVAYPGFAENTSAPGRMASGTVAADGSLVLKLFYDRLNYTVTFKDHDGTILGTDQVVYEAGATAPSPAPSRTGYTFTYWSPSYTSITADLIVTAQYAANTDTAYAIEHYQQDITGSGYTLTETDKMTGTTASSVTASAKTYAGFSENTSIASRVASGTIAADGSLVLKLYYDRNTVSVSFVDHDDSELSQQTVRYAGSATPPAEPARAGYTFAGWSGYYTEVTSDQTVTATYTANQNTPYLVQHYQQNVTGAGYTLKDTDAQSGETDTEVTALAKDYAGFTENTSYGDQVASGTITGDGKLVLKLYYDRDEVTVTFKDFDTTTVLKTETVRYEGSVTPPADPTRLGYTFNGWSGTYNSVSSDQTVLATYSPNTTTRYKVEHYQQDVIGDGYTLKETEGLTGTTDTTAIAAAKTYIGFAENSSHASKAASGNIAAAESLVLRLYYDRLTFPVTFENHDGSILHTESVRFEGDAIPPVEPDRPGYTFHSWVGDYTGVNAEQTIKASFTANTNTAYTVLHYQQNISDDGYSLKDIENLTGTTDTSAIAVARTYTGFLENTSHADRVATDPIDGDGSSVLKLFYDRKTYAVTFKNHDQSILKQETVRYGGNATPPAEPARTGYTFMGWDGIYQSVTASETVMALFSAHTTTPYRVLHYQQDVKGDGYTLTASENLTGTTDTSAFAAIRSITGFHENTSHENRAVTGNIAGDGSLVLQVYYDRDVFTVDFVDFNGSVLQREAVRYLGQATPPPDPRRERFDFRGWQGQSKDIIRNETVQATYSVIKLAGEIEVIAGTAGTLFDQTDASLIATPELWNSNVESVVFYLKAVPVTDTANRFNYIGFASDNLQRANRVMLQAYDLTLMQKITWLSGQVTEHPVDNDCLKGNITIRLPLAPELAGYSDLQVVFIDDAGNIAFLPTQIVVENGQKYLEFENNHFSMYAVAASSSLPAIPATGDASTPAISPFLARVYGIGIFLLGLVLAWYRWLTRRRKAKQSFPG